MIENTFNLISWGISTLAEMSWNMVNLKVKLLFSPLYFILFIYICARFASSCLYFWLLRVLLIGRVWEKLFIDMLLNKLVGLMIGSMDRDTMRDIIFGGGVMEVFFSLKLIQYESNVPSDDRYS